MTRLIVVTLLLAAVAIVLKVRNRSTTTLRAIKVTSRVTINRGSIIAVVEVDGRRLLVGAAPNQVNLIAELDAAAPEDPTQLSPPTGPRPFSAAAALAKLTSSKGSDAQIRGTTMPATRAEAPPAAAAPTRPVGARFVEDEPTTLVDRVRRMTTRTVEPRLRLPNQSGGAT